MAKYTVTRACGHVETIALIGKHKDREWRLENVEPQKLCSECWKADLERKREEETQKAIEEAQESGLPALEGTEKQIAWAERIRIKMLDELDVMVTKASENRDAILKEYKITLEDIDAAVRSIQAKTSASWWIDHRDLPTYSLAELLIKEIKAVTKASKPLNSAALDASAEATIRPAAPITETVAEIRAVGQTIEVVFPERREDFWVIVKKQLNMAWAGSLWQRKLGAIQSGTVQDRAAEAGHRLLAAGFVIRIFDPEIREKAITGKYEPECTRWVMLRTGECDYTGWFAISWGRDEDFYQAAKKISGSRYSKPSVVVPTTSFEEVLDFAGMYRFKLSPGALSAVEAARRIKENALLAEVSVPNEQRRPVALNQPPLLEVPTEVGIADEFKD